MRGLRYENSAWGSLSSSLSVLLLSLLSHVPRARAHVPLTRMLFIAFLKGSIHGQGLQLGVLGLNLYSEARA